MKFIAALLLVLTAAPASATCVQLGDVLTHMAERWREVPQFVGTNDRGAWMITAAPDGTTFTVFLIEDGIACLIGDGEAWSMAPSTPQGEEG